jgi:WD40 repeat protein
LQLLCPAAITRYNEPLGDGRAFAGFGKIRRFLSGSLEESVLSWKGYPANDRGPQPLLAARMTYRNCGPQRWNSILSGLSRVWPPFLLCLLFSTFLTVGLAHGQYDRRQRGEPGLIVEPGARTATCDELLFSSDGRYLFAVGDDKVVRIWDNTAQGLNAKTVQTLRWGIWREQRGSIYALALSPDGRQVAIGGLGLITGSAAVIDRATGDIVHAITDTRTEIGNTATIRALAFSPAGDRVAFGCADGSVWLWNLASGKANDTRLLGKHRPSQPRGSVNFVRLVAFRDNDRLISVAQDGRVLQWTTAPGNGSSSLLLDFEAGVNSVFRAALSADRQWLAVATGLTKETPDPQLNRVAVRSLDGKQKREIVLPERCFARSLALSRDGRWLAAAIGSVPQTANFYKETDDRVLIYDLRPDSPKEYRGPDKIYHADALAWTPDAQRLAVAGGLDHEVTLWAFDPLRKVSDMRGPGTSLWGVGLSSSGRYLGFRDHRAADPAGPNDWGTGKWRVFDLRERKWAAREVDFQPVRPIDSAGGWTVQPNPNDAFQWWVIGPNRERFVLPLDRNRDHLPRCYTFLKQEKGKPVRVVIGHYWGASVFELNPTTGPRRQRLFTGHQGEVMAVAPSADGKWLVTASRDQTIAVWSLLDWPSQSELGAGVQLQAGKLVVDRVDEGSPAWEAGLTKGDEIVRFVQNATDFLYDPEKGEPKTQLFKKLGNAEECLRRLRAPIPGQEHFFLVRRAGKAQLLPMLTALRQRPVWRFFPTRDGEWVLWRWFDYYYDTSTHGDSYIGWHVNNGAAEVEKKPSFYPAEQFRKIFYRPDKVDAVLRKLWQGDQVQIGFDRPSIPAIEPGRLAIRDAVTMVTSKDAGLTVTLSATPRGKSESQALQKAILWVNDYRVQEWQRGDKDWPQTAAAFQQKVTIPRDVLRRGENQVTFQCYNQAGARSNNAFFSVTYQAPQVTPRLYGLTVGINDYSRTVPGPGGETWLDLNFARDDAVMMRDIWSNQKDRLYPSTDIVLKVDQQATRAEILKQLKVLAERARPDDRIVLFLGGHGWADPKKPGSFTFCCPKFDIRQPAKTGITSQDLYQALAALPCRKLVLLDCCHAGDILKTNPIRDLTPDGVGPVILAACGPHEAAVEDTAVKKHGLFTWSIHEVLTRPELFAQADTDKDGTLDPDELAVFVKSRVPTLLEDVKQEILRKDTQAAQRMSEKDRQELKEITQTPIAFLPWLDRLPLARERGKAASGKR